MQYLKQTGTVIKTLNVSFLNKHLVSQLFRIIFLEMHNLTYIPHDI
jgi:hypothetical protein